MLSQPKLFESLFKRSYTDPGNLAFLRELTAKHPYFSPAQFFLLRQSEPGSSSFEKQAGVTNLFFSNPLWLNLRLLETGVESMPSTRQSQSGETAPEPVLEMIEHEEHSSPEPAVQQLEQVVIESEDIREEISIEESSITEQPIVESTVGLEDEPEVIMTEEIPEEISIEEPVVTIEAVSSPIQEEVIEPGPVQEQVVQADETVTNNTGNMVMNDTEKASPEEPKIPEELPLFEPMHMVDYFASQGIKLSEEMQTADKLGKQLKSFTEWLKTMKKVHTAMEQPTGSPDKSVEDLAEKSNEENEVITEAMAEVFARQGKKAKAVAVYQKLSLLNPAKSAYFAAKIENLKDA